MTKYEAVIGLEVHAELQTKSKMFCGCPVVDNTKAPANSAVCPVCCGMPGVLPVVNQMAVEYALKVALALDCTINHTSIFARKNYFYPDLPKGYQISQYEEPLAEHGRLRIYLPDGSEKDIRVLRVHLEEDTGKLTHVEKKGEQYSLVDLNRAGVPLLEIVTEPDMRSVEEAKAYATELHALIKSLGVNSGNMSKGVMRFEANVSVREQVSDVLNTRVEIKNLNSFRSMERAAAYQIEEQIKKMERGEKIRQETLGWNEAKQVTFSQRGKEEAHDYRYFPEPDLPPLIVADEWVERVKAGLPELPRQRMLRFAEQYKLSQADAELLARDEQIAAYFERCAAAGSDLKPRQAANWITGTLFAWMNQTGTAIDQILLTPEALIEIIHMQKDGKLNANSAKTLVEAVLKSGASPAKLAEELGLQQISNQGQISEWVGEVLEQHPKELQAYLNGKETLQNWFFGQVMRSAKGKASPAVLKEELSRQLEKIKSEHTPIG